MPRFLLVRALLSVAVFGALLVTARPADASSPATAWTVYGDVIVEAMSPADRHTGVVLRPRS